MEFAAPSTGGGDSVKPADLEGHLVVIEPTSYEASITTSFGDKDAVRCTIHDISGSESYEDALLFGQALIRALKPNIGKRVLGVIGKGVAKPGQAAPWVINDASSNEQAVAAATAYLTGQVAASITPPAPTIDPQADALAAALGNLQAAGISK